jgi:hypothetical protein
VPGSSKAAPPLAAPPQKIMVCTSKSPPPPPVKAPPQQQEEEEATAGPVSVWDSRPMPPPPAADLTDVDKDPALEAALDEDVAIWETVRAKLQPWVDLPDNGELGQNITLLRLTGGKEKEVGLVARLRLGWAPAKPNKCKWPWTYVGYHGTDLMGLRGIMKDRRIRADEQGSRAVYCKATKDDTVAEKTRVLHQVMTGTKATAAAFEIRVKTDVEHAPVKANEGGTQRQADLSETGVVTHYRSGKESRWTFPEEQIETAFCYLQVMALCDTDIDRFYRSAEFLQG